MAFQQQQKMIDAPPTTLEEQLQADLSESEYLQAIQTLEKILKKNSQAEFTEPLLQGIARAYLHLNQIEEGLFFFQIRFEQKQLSLKNNLNYPKFLMLLEKWDQVENLLQNQAHCFQKEDQEWLQKFLEEHQKFQQKEGHQGKGTQEEDNPQLVQFYRDIKDQNWRAAAESLLEGKVQPPQLSTGENLRGLIFRFTASDEFYQGRFDRAIYYWEQAFLEFPEDLPLYINACCSLSLCSSPMAYPIYMKTIELFKKNAKENPQAYSEGQLQHTLAELKAMKAKSLYLRGEKKEGKVCLLHAKEGAPQSIHVLRVLAFWYQAEDQPQKAIPYVEQLFQQNTSHRNNYELLKELYHECGEAEKEKQFRLQYGEKFDDEVLSDQNLRLLFGVALNSKDVDFLSWVLDEKIDPTDSEHPFLVLGALFEEIFEEYEENEGDDGFLELDQDDLLATVNDALSDVEVHSFLYYSIYELTICGLTGFHLSEDLQNTISSWGKLSLYKTSTIQGNQSYIIIQFLLESDLEEIHGSIKRLLSQSEAPHDLLVEMQQILSSYGQPEVLHDDLEKALKLDPENPSLLLSYATSCSEEQEQQAEKRYHQGLEIARQLQHQKALDYHKQEMTLDEVWYEWSQKRGILVEETK